MNMPEVWEREIWPPSICNPLDYFVWGIAELQINKASYNTTDSLISKIKEAKGQPWQGHRGKGLKQFRSRLEAVVEADRGFMELKDS